MFKVQGSMFNVPFRCSLILKPLPPERLNRGASLASRFPTEAFGNDGV
jgi:hypothetical protein